MRVLYLLSVLAFAPCDMAHGQRIEVNESFIGPNIHGLEQ